MNDWEVILTPKFKMDVKNIYSYIANTLLNPISAINQVKRIITITKSLNEIPMRFPLYEKEPWHKRGLRKMPIDNFIFFYLIDEKTKKVIVLHIFYAGKNIDGIIIDD